MIKFSVNFDSETIVLMQTAMKVAKENRFNFVDEGMLLATYVAMEDSILSRYFLNCGRSYDEIKEEVLKYFNEYILSHYEDNEDKDKSYGILMKFTSSQLEKDTNSYPLSKTCLTIILKASEIAKKYYNSSTVKCEHILAAIAEIIPDEYEHIINLCLGKESHVYRELPNKEDKEDFISFHEDDEHDTEILEIPEELAGCLTVLNNQYSPNEEFCRICGRDDETNELITILAKATKRNAILVGKPGVGKTAIVEKFTWDIVHGKCNPKFKDAKVIALDVTGIVAGTRYRGMAEEKFKILVKFLEKHPECILFIDEIHDIIGAGACTEGELDLSDSLKPILARGNTRVIGATTATEYEKYFSKDGAMKRRFEKIDVKEPRTSKVYDMIKNQIKYLEEYHKVTISKEVIDFAILNASCFKNTTMNPDRTLDVLDRSMTYAELQGKETVKKEDVLKNFAVNRKLFKNMTIAQKRETAYHEAGHALVNLFAPELKNNLVLKSISIIPTEDHLGITVWESNEETVIPSTREYYIQYIASILAGRRAEMTYTATLSSGASTDLSKATKIAKNMVMKWGLEDFDKRVWHKPGPNDDDYAILTAKTTNKVDAAIDKILKEAQDYADNIIKCYQQELEILADALVKNGLMSKKEIDEILKTVHIH